MFLLVVKMAATRKEHLYRSQLTKGNSMKGKGERAIQVILGLIIRKILSLILLKIIRN